MCVPVVPRCSIESSTWASAWSALLMVCKAFSDMRTQSNHSRMWSWHCGRYYAAFVKNFQDPFALITQSGGGFVWGPFVNRMSRSDLLSRDLPATPSAPLIR
ncbi:hypothetical protein BGX23_007639, partial [Mortierella sp. AD031]